ncbi:hypothetical protein GW17_00015816 [Ensete ventricosum]|nr:hypothetical protein GW17_00015816 [Ensete ventricosum]
MWSAHMARHDPIHMVRHSPTYPQTKQALGAERAGELRPGVVLPAIRLLQPKVSSSMNPFLYCEGEPLDPSSCEVSRLREIAGEMH